MAIYKRLRQMTDTLLDGLLIVLISVVALLVFIQVLLRYVFHAPLMGIEELLLFPTTWLFMLGAVRASSEKTQIVARVLEIFSSSPRFISGLRAIAAIASTAVLLWLSKWGYDYLKYLLRMQKESPTLYIPTIWYEAMVFAALVLMVVYTLIELCEHVRHFLAGTAEALKQEGDE
ncbi:MAG: TRAP transporter small permease subunit [Fretibacterium sp.]|nr:TRAP transporter small permease subunit [Fretibacterium sp.]